jgi:hypothetical protein
MALSPTSQRFGGPMSRESDRLHHPAIGRPDVLQETHYECLLVLSVTATAQYHVGKSESILTKGTP